MASSFAEPGPAGVVPPPPSRSPTSKSEARLRPRPATDPPPQPSWRLAVPAVVALLLAHPLLWSAVPVPLWTPALGLAFALMAWVGPARAVALLTIAAALLLLRHAAFDVPAGEWLHLARVGLDVGLLVAVPLLGWWLYSDCGRGGRRLNGPRAATLFIFLVPGVTATVAAAVRAVFLVVAAPVQEPLGLLFARLWLDHALGLVAVAPPLLVLLTTWLSAWGLARPESARDRAADPERGSVATSAPPPTAADWVEITALAIGAGLLCLLLSWLSLRRELMGWQLWGLQLLFTVWAAVRQGLRGGTLVAASAAALPLLTRQLWPTAEEPLFLALLQGHLFAQGTTALLVASAAMWARSHETGYRQVVAHIPVVIYSARLLPRVGGPLSPNALPGSGVAEVTLVSAASQGLLNCPADQLLGDYARWLACIHAEDREVVLAALDQLTRQEQPVSCEYRLAPAGDGSSRSGKEPTVNARPVRWVRDTLAPHRDADGRLVGWEGVVTDITEQRALADDLRRTTSMFNTLVGNLPAGVFFVQGTAGRPILVNARARQLLGQREDSSAGLDHLPRVYRLFRADGSLYPAEELPVYIALRHGRTTMRDDIVVHRPDGRRVPLVSWAAPVSLGGRGGPDAAVWVLEDLTAVHQAEAARKDSEGRLRAVIETMAEGLLVHDPRGVIVSCNPAAGTLFSLPPEQVRGRGVFDLGWVFVRENGTPLPREEHPSQVALRSGRPVRNVVLGAYPANATPLPGAVQPVPVRWLLAHAMPLVRPDQHGSSGVVTTLSDISGYVQAREAIRVSEERFRGLVEALPLMVVLLDRQMNLTYVNPATTAVSGYSLDEVRTLDAWSAVIQPEDRPPILELYRTALAGQPGRGEIRYRAKDGGERTAIVLVQPRYQGEGVIVGAMSLLVDVTRERQLERDLQRSQRLELIGRLASGVAHDFNNLLSVVLNLTDLARCHLPGDHPVHGDLRRITEAGEQAASLAGQLLAFSKQRAVPSRRVDVNRVVRRTLELLRATLPATIEVQPDLTTSNPEVCGDDTQVQQVVMNLCLNARDAMPHGGTMRVTTALGPGGRAVVLSVQDSGQGMTDAVRQRIFEPFYSTKETGSGLGLAIVQQIVESYRGTVEVDSRPQEGSRFRVSWPVASSGVGG